MLKEQRTALKGQLKRNGELGRSEGWCFVSGDTISDRLGRDGTDMLLTIGLSFRNPRTQNRYYDNASAIGWFEKYGRSYTFEANYTGDGFLHVTALSDNDLF